MILREKPADLTDKEWKWEQRIGIAIGAVVFLILALWIAEELT